MIREAAIAGAALICLAGGAHAANLKLSSPDIKPNAMIAEEQVANTFGCTGKNMSPALKWSAAPANAKSFALTVYDPDAPTGSGFWHWQIYNIPTSVTSLPKNAGDTTANLAPAGSIQGHNDFGVAGWGGPCPPKGDKPHRYVFTIFALDIDKLPIPDPAPSAAVVGFLLHAHTVAKGSFTGRYGH
jgi:Raf kinase inhibitor-like YbhB/YbcL family protein